MAQPAGIPDKFEDQVRLLYDLQLLAYQSDLTRVTTFMYGREQTGRPYPQIGVPEPHHPLTHHQGNPEKMAKCAKIQRTTSGCLPSISDKLRNTPDGDGSLLDHVILLFGSGISNSDRHTHGPLPTFLVGGGAGTLKGGRHLVYPRTHATDESATDAAEQAGRAGREAGRQQRRVQRTVGAVLNFLRLNRSLVPHHNLSKTNVRGMVSTGKQPAKAIDYSQRKASIALSRLAGVPAARPPARLRKTEQSAQL